VTQIHAVPQQVGVQLAHAAVQAISDRQGLDIVHIKGAALDVSLAPRNPDGSVARLSSDADVWVRPSQIRRFVALLSAAGWKQVVRFEDGSAFEHASTFWHHYLGYLDVHRRFPGITLDERRAFELLWEERTATDIAGYPCTVPSLVAQRLIVALHVARGADRPGDLDRAWTSLDDAGRAGVRDLADRLGATAALAVGVHGPDGDTPEAQLWRLRTAPGVPLGQVWLARVRAQRTPWGKARVAVRQVVPSRRRLEFLAGHPLTVSELLRTYARRAATGVTELRRLVWPRRPPHASGADTPK